MNSLYAASNKKKDDSSARNLCVMQTGNYRPSVLCRLNGPVRLSSCHYCQALSI